MYSGFFLGLLAFVAIIPLYETAIALPATGLVTCTPSIGCKKIDGVQPDCCTPPNKMPVKTGLSMPAITNPFVPNICAPSGTVCCQTNTNCTKAAVASFTVDGFCCQNLGICLATQKACDSLTCTKQNPTCTDGMKCCITQVPAVSGVSVPVSIPVDAVGTCLPKSEIPSAACADLSSIA